jgi:hypothetical protein
MIVACVGGNANGRDADVITPGNRTVYKIGGGLPQA